MIRRKGNFETEVRENMRGGDGSVKIEKLWDPEKDLKANNRLFAKLTIEPGCGIGFHNHDKEEEVFVILKGKAEADDNGETVLLNAGDTILTGNGTGHAIKNIGDETLEIIAVISSYVN
jgi:mannose-6-phosphate isomerase-like protein (cupin superfamily)